MPIPSKIRPLGIDDDHVHLMIVAGPGWGKTVLAGTAPNALFLTTDPEGTVSAKVRGSTAREWKIESWTEFNEAYRYLRDGGIEEAGVQWLIVDNISEAQNLGMRETMDIARKFNPKLDEFIPSQQDYQRSQNMLREMVKRFHDLPVNIIWTAWRKNDAEDEDGNVQYAAAIHGQKGALAETIMGYMNMVGFGDIATNEDGKAVRRIYFDQVGPHRGKDRFGVMGPYRDSLKIPQLDELVRAQIEKHRRPAAPAAPRPAARKVAEPTAVRPRRTVATKGDK